MARPIATTWTPTEDPPQYSSGSWFFDNVNTVGQSRKVVDAAANGARSAVLYFRSLSTAYGANTHVMYHNAANTYDLMIWNNGTPNPLIIYDGATIWGDSYLLTTNWTMACYTYDGTTLVYYVNGALKESNAAAEPTSDWTLRLGVAGQTLTGYVGGVWEWGRALTATEVTNMYDGTQPTGPLLTCVFTGTVPGIVDSTANSITGLVVSGDSGEPAWDAAGYYEFQTASPDGITNLHTYSEVTTAMTLSAWVNLSSTPQYATLFSFVSGAVEEVKYYITGANPEAGYATQAIAFAADGTLRNFTTNQSWPSTDTNVWRNLVVTYEGAATPSVAIYVSGTNWPLGITNNITSLPQCDQLSIGRDGGTLTQGTDGKLDEVRVWRRRLSTNEIAVVATNKPAQVP